MLHVQTNTVQGNAVPAVSGLERGTEVITLAGIRRVESLRCGDRIVTRAGARPLKALSENAKHFALEFDTPQIVLLAQGQAHSDTGRPYAA